MFSSNSQKLVVFIFFCSLFVLILIGFCMLIVYRYQQKQNLYFKNIEDLRILHENTILISQIEIQEQTFQHVSREIHDNIGQKLSLAKLHLNTLYADSQESIDKRILDSVKILTETIRDLSNLSRGMSSENILRNGLVRALEDELSLIKQLGRFKIEFEIQGRVFYHDKSIELVIYRIVQEALNNIIKHSSAKSIFIDFLYDLNAVTLIIADDGNGFDLEEKNGRGIGIANMKRRAMIIGGQCDIKSRPGHGTELIIKIPSNE